MGQGEVAIHVLIAHPDTVVRAGLARFVRRRFRVVGAVGDGWSALREIRRLRPDVAVLGPGLAGLSADGVLNAVMREELPTRIVFLDSEPHSERVYAALEAGVGGYVSTRASESEIIEALERLAGGETVIPRELQTGLVTAIRLRRTVRS